MELTPFVTTLLGVTREYWVANQRPLLLSNLPAILANQQVDYRAVLGKETLKSFVERTSDAASYKVITHPVHRAKIGLVPPDVNYEFEADSEPAQETALSDIAPVPNDAIALLNILSKLDAEDLEKITIPVSVLAKLFKQR
ncbi:hypothetical protein PMI22_02529 [Pseudomonas sp. GM21]|jgi:hypothetical protein|uniref:hypothetical protein n=1 Tax=Pseudomonas TaxID=286 RepID=UPI000272594B|nr:MULTISPECIES: hypothetical protein [Pseudomonas]EJM20413.1 hypothetical protein PMI22_02529 [Pseudomonas sp. GM21]MDR6926605.1 hypothetical protein [Pseudomonas sp. BE134]MDR7283283.1 hypothetical protein [Pseudomonas corrugata]